MVHPDAMNRSTSLTRSTDDGQELQEILGPDRKITARNGGPTGLLVLAFYERSSQHPIEKAGDFPRVTGLLQIEMAVMLSRKILISFE